MIPPRFEYYAPVSIEEAVKVLDRFGGEAKVLAGGQSLLPVLKLRLAEPKAVVDINRIPDLAYIREEGDVLRIGALARTNDLNDSDLVRRRYPILTDAVSMLADPLVRNLGTVGGNVAHGDPANDLPACMLALGASFVARGPNAPRTIAAGAFYVDTFTTALEPNEILTEIRIPKARAGQGNAYLSLEKRVGDFAIVGVAANIVLGAQGTVEAAGIGITSAGPTAIKATEAERSLVGRTPDDAAFDRAAKHAMDVARPTSDLRGPAEYKRAMVGVLAARALRRSLERARGGA
ncbi:MAG: FAD binding domain-containing protein [Methanobacteriota archaeon]